MDKPWGKSDWCIFGVMCGAVAMLIVAIIATGKKYHWVNKEQNIILFDGIHYKVKKVEKVEKPKPEPEYVEIEEKGK